MLSKLSLLSIASLGKLDEEANKFYDRKHDFYQTALLTRCDTQHALRPYIDSEINHDTLSKFHSSIRVHCIDFIDLPSIFRDNTVESSIPAYFENKEPPVICYKYNKLIRSTIFNFNKLVADLDIDTTTQDPRDCKNSAINQQAILLQEILKLISDTRICSIVSKGPKYRLPSQIDFNKCREEIAMRFANDGAEENMSSVML